MIVAQLALETLLTALLTAADRDKRFAAVHPFDPLTPLLRTVVIYG